MVTRLWRIGKTAWELLRESEPLKWRELLQVALQEANEIGELFLQVEKEETKIYQKDPHWDILWVAHAKEKLLKSQVVVSFSAPFHLWLDIGVTVSKKFKRTGKLSFSSPKFLNELHYYPEKESPTFPVNPSAPFSYDLWRKEVWFPEREIIDEDGGNILLKALEEVVQRKLDEMNNHYHDTIQDRKNSIQLKMDQITLKLRDWVTTRFSRIALHIAKQSSIPEGVKEKLQFIPVHKEYPHSQSITSYGSLMIPKRGVKEIQTESDGFVIYKSRFSDHPPSLKSYYAPSDLNVGIKQMAQPTFISDLTTILKKDLNSLPKDRFFSHFKP